MELAKTCWNAFITNAVPSDILQDMEVYLALAEQIFSVIFGDGIDRNNEDEPIYEVTLLRKMLRAEVNCANHVE